MPATDISLVKPGPVSENTWKRSTSYICAACAFALTDVACKPSYWLSAAHWLLFRIEHALFLSVGSQPTSEKAYTSSLLDRISRAPGGF